MDWSQIFNVFLNVILLIFNFLVVFGGSFRKIPVIAQCYWLKSFDEPTGLFNPDYLMNTELEDKLGLLRFLYSMTIILSMTTFACTIYFHSRKYTKNPVPLTIMRFNLFLQFINFIITSIVPMLFLFHFIAHLSVYDPYNPNARMQKPWITFADGSIIKWIILLWNQRYVGPALLMAVILPSIVIVNILFVTLQIMKVSDWRRLNVDLKGYF